MAVLLALCSALSYGLSDFVGGVLARRTSPWSVAVVGQTSSFLCVAVLAVAGSGHPSAGDLGWAVLAGVGTGSGAGFLYRGLGAGRMAVVAPVSAVGAAVVPVLVGALAGERPSLVVWLGVAAALPGIWLVSREESLGTTARGSGLLEGVLAGIGFGVLFAGLGQVPEGAGLWPLCLAEVAAVLTTLVAALALGGDPRPRGGLEWWGLASGLLAAAAGLAFLLATHHGLLSVSAVLVSLYPAFTVLLAALVLREHIHRAQAWGLGLCAVAVVLVAAG